MRTRLIATLALISVISLLAETSAADPTSADHANLRQLTTESSIGMKLAADYLYLKDAAKLDTSGQGRGLRFKSNI